MLVIRVDEFGGPEVLQPVEVPDPVPGPGEVVVEVEAAGVLTLDTLIRRGGAPGPRFATPLPYFPGRGAAGRIRAVGAGVDPGRLGQRVLADVEGGAYAEQLVAPVGALLPVPEGLEAAEAMVMLHDGGTALAVFGDVGVRPGELVLVLPAAGGVGSLLVQLARSTGARVLAAARGAEKLALARSLGADLAVDYGEAGWADAVRRRVGLVDVVVDGVGGALGRAAFGLVAEGGRYSNYGMAGGPPTEVDPAEAYSRGVSVRGLEQLAGSGGGRRARQERMLREAAAGRIRPVVGRRFPLAKAADAHTALQDREIVGKAVLVP
ncbi:zinc-binding dehydrogenase [Pseudonocardia kujensis]|uniref:zinc-binding dehydrogenase n=1 Tax=Pseudonocardia kujensis TaxID=1128675 RepID=UPI001E45D46F|nr:zinc-binding dehydrogenase [Pseudonocardia kujensis]MCE0765861.1 zinc-binding dehydrogenase [Pseudonocardia kujensis]